jgi:hypothetical protein
MPIKENNVMTDGSVEATFDNGKETAPEQDATGDFSRRTFLRLGALAGAGASLAGMASTPAAHAHRNEFYGHGLQRAHAHKTGLRF